MTSRQIILRPTQQFWAPPDPEARAAVAAADGNREPKRAESAGKRLPHEIFERVFSYVNCPKTLSGLGLVCRRWHALSIYDGFWTNLCIHGWQTHPRCFDPNPKPKTLYKRLADLKRKVLRSQKMKQLAAQLRLPMDVAESLFSKYSGRVTVRARA